MKIINEEEKESETEIEDKIKWLEKERNRLEENLKVLGGNGLIMFDEYTERELNLVKEEIKKTLDKIGE